MLASAFDRRFFGGRTLESLDAGCRFVINATNLTTGERFAFERDVVGDYVLGMAPTAGTSVRGDIPALAGAAMVPSRAGSQRRPTDAPVTSVCALSSGRDGPAARALRVHGASPAPRASC